jgi:hypothetical protein
MVNWRQHRHDVPSRKNGVMHHKSLSMPSCVDKKLSTDLLFLLKLSELLLSGLLLGLALLQESLRDENLALSGHAPMSG